MTLYDSIVPCFGSRFTTILMPLAKRYRVFPLGTFHYFDWEKHDDVGISIGTCPQIVSSETAQLGVVVEGVRRVLPFDDGETFSRMTQDITPLCTMFDVADDALSITAKFTFRSAFYPKSFEYSTAPAYSISVELHNPSQQVVTAEVFFGLPLQNATVQGKQIHASQSIVFPDGIDHAGIDGLTFQQLLTSDLAQVDESAGVPVLRASITLNPHECKTVQFYHAGYIAQPTLNQQGKPLKFGYTTIWGDAEAAVQWWRTNEKNIIRKGDLFESTILKASVAPELKQILSAAFKGVASNAWWAEDDWFSMMEIGAYHSTLDVDFQLALFFLQYWEELVGRMLNQWAVYYVPGSGYMAHDVGQHLEATGNRYGGPGSAMKVEENCNYLILLHHYWRVTGDEAIVRDKAVLIGELVKFLLAADTTGSGLPNRYADNTNDWGSGLITASEEQSYHGVRLVVAYTAVTQIAHDILNDVALEAQCQDAITRINETMEQGWAGDHYPISFADAASAHHYSMWTTHGLLYAARTGMAVDLDLDKLRIDLITSTQRTMHEHGSVHSTVDVRGWLTQNLWRDCCAAYLGVDLTNNLRRYLGHGEYVSYEDTTILEVANELMVVPGATAEHEYAGQIHNFPMVDGHPRPACGFGLLYALGGIQYDRITQWLNVAPVSFPLRIALTHLADWEQECVPWISFTRSIPNQDQGYQPSSIHFTLENESLLSDVTIRASHDE